MNHRISIIVPTYQHANTLPACLDSILAQTRQLDEVIVINDGSTDQTNEILAGYQKKGVVSFFQSNQGAPSARNHGFRVSTGDLVLFCDADVIMRPEMLLQLEEALRAHPEASYAYSGFKWGWKTFTSFAFDQERLKKENFIHTSALIRREAFPGFDESLKRFQDWDLWLTMLSQGQIGTHVPRILYQVRKDASANRISFWVPSPLVHFPWRLLGWKPKKVKKYEELKQIVMRKHHLL